MNNLANFIRNITTHCHNFPEDMQSCILKSPNMYDSIIKCDIGHPGRSCFQQSLFMALKSVNSTYKSFLIANLIPVIIYKRKELRTNPKKVLYRLCISLLRSFIFCMNIGSLFAIGWCGVNSMSFDGSKSLISFYIAIVCANVGIWAESTAKVEETFLYLLTNFFQMTWNYLKKKYSVRAIPMFTNFLFALTVGLFYSTYAHDDGNMKSKYRLMCDQVFSLDKKSNKSRTEIEHKD